MASNRGENTSSEPSEKQSNRHDGLNRQQSINNQQERALNEVLRILPDWRALQLQSNVGWMKNKRIPRLYSINKNQTVLIILQGDITRTKLDAIVNAANEHMTGGSGVDGIIHSAAGDELYWACKAHKQVSSGVRLPTGHSRILLSYNMSKTTYYIINTAGPMYRRNEAARCAEQLSSCYSTALALANLYDLESIGFTAISCGIFGYPANDGADVALRTVDKEANSLPVVVFVLWDNHIYDAWVQKAEELKFDVYNPECATTVNPSEPSIDDDQKKTTQNPTTDDDQREASTTVTPIASNLSTQNETEKVSTDNGENLLVRLPSVPSGLSDTQQIEDMDQDDILPDINHQLNTQKTTEMTDVNPETKESQTNNNPEDQPSQEESNKLDDEKVKIETVEDKQHHSPTTDGPGSQDNKFL